MSEAEVQAVEGVEEGPVSPVQFVVPDKPFEDFNPLEKRWFKIKSIPTFPYKVAYYGDCGLPIEYCEFLPENLRMQAMEVHYKHYKMILVCL
jgi:hypothetical protein